jgi:hypothetical protein
MKQNLFCLIVIFIILSILIKNYFKKCNLENFIKNLYKKKFKLSVIILNYNRPHNIPILVNKLKKIKLIDDIIISHGKKETTILIKDPIVTNEVNLRNKYYSATRFELSKMAKNNFILFIDDDLYPHENLMYKILKKIDKDGLKNNLNLYGPFKRSCLDKYYTKLNFSKSNIVLTKLAVVNKNTAIEVWEKIKKTKYLDILLKNKGNGEDIIFATFINKLGGKNIYVSGKFYDLDGTNGYSSDSEHYKVRSDLCYKLSNDKELNYS